MRKRSDQFESAENRLWITTSWDDGHPLDSRIADLLHRYGIAGTFYVPIRSQLPVMDSSQMRHLAAGFEIGGHTVNHVRLDTIAPERSREEIFGSKQRVEDITGAPCVMFCPPSGAFRRTHLVDIRNAGYESVRTVELMSVSPPASREGLSLVPTTLHVFPHPPITYFRNAIKRLRWNNVATYCRHTAGLDMVQMASSLLNSLLESGGVFHLWGHSWELEQTRLWDTLEAILKQLDARRDRCRFVTNGELCAHFRSTKGPAAKPSQRGPKNSKSLLEVHATR